MKAGLSQAWWSMEREVWGEVNKIALEEQELAGQMHT